MDTEVSFSKELGERWPTQRQMLQRVILSRPIELQAKAV
jgi:hypothetical protein